MKTEKEIQERHDEMCENHRKIMGGRAYTELSESEQAYVDGLWHMTSILHWTLSENVERTHK